MSNFALLVGVNKYQTPGNDLRGCLNDVDHMRTLLGNCGFSVMHVRSLTNEQATKKRILNSLEQMVMNAKSGDHLVWHHSSHGSQMPSSDPHEPDFMTEILCPYDFDWVPAYYITDDEVNGICTKLNPEATLDIFLDSCHSGDMLREIGDPMPRFIPFPVPVASGLAKVKRILQDHSFDNVALWSGCKSDQTSADALIDGEMQGAMTWGVTEGMAKGLSQYAGFDLRGNLIETIKVLLGQKGFEQEPQLEASDEMKVRKIFE